MGLSLKTLKEDSVKIPLNMMEPNTWNMNELPDDKYRKLKKWIKECIETLGKVPLPVVIRKRPGFKKYQIIDGEHRWRAHNDLKYEEIDSYIYNCDDRQAKLLTNALNYLRGDPNPEKEANYVQNLVSSGLDLDDIVAHTDYTKSSLDDIILKSGITIEEIETPMPGSEDPTAKVPEAWTELKFVVPVEVAELAEAEIARIASTLSGKNLRGRAFEYIIVNSSQTPLPDATKMTFRLALSKKKKT